MPNLLTQSISGRHNQASTSTCHERTPEAVHSRPQARYQPRTEPISDASETESPTKKRPRYHIPDTDPISDDDTTCLEPVPKQRRTENNENQDPEILTEEQIMKEYPDEAKPVLAATLDDPNRHQCSRCEKFFTSKFATKRHIEEKHKKSYFSYPCRNEGCNFKTKRLETIRDHVRRCRNSRQSNIPLHFCFCCQENYSTKKVFAEHVRTSKHKLNEDRAKQNLPPHKRKQKLPKKKPQPKKWMIPDDEDEPKFPDDAPEELKEAIAAKWHYIRQQTIADRPLAKCFIVRNTDGVNFADVMRDIYAIMDYTPYDIALEAASILRSQQTDPETGEEKYEYEVRYPSKNSPLLKLTRINNILDLEKAIETYEEADLEQIMKVSPSSRQDLVGIPSIQIRLYPKKKFRMICGQEIYNGSECDETLDERVIRRYIEQSTSIRSLLRRPSRQHYAQDNLCVFRTIADELLEQKGPPNPYQLNEYSLEQLTHHLYQDYVGHMYPTHTRNIPANRYQGTTRNELPLLEAYFRVKLDVYKLEITKELKSEARRRQQDIEGAIREIEDADLWHDDNVEEPERAPLRIEQDEPQNPNNEPTRNLPRERWVQGRLYRKSLIRDSSLPTVNVVLFRGHMHRVTNVNAMVKTWKCERCGHLYDRAYECRIHQQGCTTKTPRCYPAAGYTNPKSIFQKIRELGFDIADQFHKHRIAYDFEAMFKRKRPGLGKLRYIARLEPISASVIANFNGSANYNIPSFICEPEPKTVVEDFYELITKIATEIGQANEEEFRAALDFCAQKAKLYEDLVKSFREKEYQDDNEKQILLNRISAAKEYNQINKEFKRWVYQVPVIGFNSGKFDVNLVRTYLLPAMLRNKPNDNIDAIIERGSDFLSISTEKLHFIDLAHYLAPGVSLDDFNRTYGDNNYQGKFPWCYEIITSFEDLLKPFPDDKSAFKSTLKNREMTDQEFADARALYDRHGCTNMLQFLRIYNNSDVEPFLISISNFIDIFKNMAQIDIFKNNIISLPGAAFRWMFSRQHDCVIPLFTEKYKSWHEKLRENVVGGPSIVFKRLAEIGSRIRDTNNLCRRIVGVDANALYPYCTAQDMPTGIARVYSLLSQNYKFEEVPVMKPDVAIPLDEIQRRIDTNLDVKLKQELAYSSKLEIPWVICATRRIRAQERKPHLQVMHALNGGQKRFLSRDGKVQIWVDGYIPELKRVIEYNGCWHHGHPCQTIMTQIRNCTDPVTADQRRQQQWDRTEARRLELEAQGLTVETKWECEHREIHDQDMQEAVKEVIPPTPLGLLTAKKLIDRVASGEFFGLVECDLQVPYWDEQLRSTLSEFPPIFKNVNISQNDVGRYMKDFTERRGLFRHPRRSLIGSYFGAKVVMITPLLKYYLSKGLKITRVYGALEYVPQKPFAFVTEEVTRLRRLADQEGDRAAKARGNTAKLLANSCYGKCLTNVDNHETVKLVTEAQADKGINHILFSKLDPVDDSTYLIHYKKNKIYHRLPLLISYFVYQMAKLVMIRFYLDFLLAHIGRDKFELLQTDTDSFYLSLAGESFESVATTPNFDQIKGQFLEGPNNAREPGVFKTEWSGTQFIALNPKCYFGLNENGDSKLSSKGVSHRTNRLTYQNYKDVLLDRTSVPVHGPLAAGQTTRPMIDLTNVPSVNRGFRKHEGKIHYYALFKSALTHVYIKRKLLPDMINTEPLDL